jgi:putative transposase
VRWYKGGVGIRRTKHAVYELKYHLVWVPKFRANILGGEVGQYVKEVFLRIADEYEFHIDTMEVMEDHVHVFIEAPPGYAPAQVVQIMKSISAREVFKRFPKMRRAMWSGMIWGDGYFVRSVGDKVTADVIRKYIQYQKQEDTPSQLMMFERPST